jgi:hypothetical protein
LDERVDIDYGADKGRIVIEEGDNRGMSTKDKRVEGEEAE